MNREEFQLEVVLKKGLHIRRLIANFSVAISPIMVYIKLGYFSILPLNNPIHIARISYENKRNSRRRNRT